MPIILIMLPNLVTLTISSVRNICSDYSVMGVMIITRLVCIISSMAHRLIQGPVHPSFGLVKCTAGRVYPSNSASWTGNNPSKVH